jgi:hypothetical protein
MSPVKKAVVILILALTALPTFAQIQMDADGDVNCPIVSSPQENRGCPASDSNARPTTPLIAFVEEGNLYMWQDGTRRTLLDTANIERVWLKPDGTRLVFIQGDGRVEQPGFEGLVEYQYRSTSLWAIDPDGENLQPLVDLDDYRGDLDYGTSLFIHKLEWVPGTTLIAFNTFHQSELALFSNTHANLFTVDTETGERVLAHMSDEYGQYAISPDGLYAAITTETEISIIGLDGRMVLPDVYSFEQSADTLHNYYYPDMRWAADSESLLAIDLTTRVGWTEIDDGKPVYPAVDVVQIHMDGTTTVLASDENEEFNYWTLRFVANGPQAIYSTGDEADCNFVALTLTSDIQLAPSSQNTVICYGSDRYAFIALTPEGVAYRLEQRAGAAILSRACDDFSACEIVQEIEGQLRSLDFIDETQYTYRVLVNDGADVFHESRDLFYAALGEEPQYIGTTTSQYPDDVFSVSQE